MKQLAINIEYLLLSRNCVIVPRLGAFSARTFASQWLEDEEILLPPVRHIRFNADIFQDPDNIFVHSLMQIYSLSEEEAEQLCNKMVSDFHKSLVSEGTVDFGSIGLFTLEDDMEITMSPYECGIVSPDYYGLDTLHFPLLEHVPAEEAAQPESAAVEIAEDTPSNVAEPHPLVIAPKGRTYVADSKHIVIRLNRAFVHYTMVAAASVLLFFLLGPGIDNEQMAEGVRQATVQHILLPSSSDQEQSAPAIGLQKCDSVNTALSIDEPAVSEELQNHSPETDLATSVDAKPGDKMVQTVEPVVQASIDNTQVFNQLRGNYCIVLASAISQKNAIAFVESLQEIDVNAILYDNGKMLRVVIDGFDSQADAYNVNGYLHNLDDRLKSTWVMKN